MLGSATIITLTHLATLKRTTSSGRTPMSARSLLASLVLILLVSLVTLDPGSAQSPTVIDLGTLGGLESAAYEVNNLGQVVGTSQTYDDGSGSKDRAFLWQDGHIFDLGTLTGPDGDSSGATDINDAGQVVGQSSNEAGNSGAFLWYEGVMIELPGLTPDNYSSFASAINNKGVAVGASYTTAACPEDQSCQHAVRWINGEVLDLGTLGGPSSIALAINERGEVVGNSYTSEGNIHAFLWNAGTMVDLGPTPDTEYSTADIINNRGRIIGFVGPLDGSSTPTSWYHGDSIRIEDLYPEMGHYDVAPQDLNEFGTIVGSYWPMGWPVMPFNAFAYSNRAFRDLSDLWGSPSVAWAVNNDGWIVGQATVAYEYPDPDDPDTILTEWYVHAHLMIP